MSNLRWINLNLLPILREVLRQRNVTRASEVLNMSQSAVSGALRQLRELSGDDLLVARGRQLIKTPFAERISEDLDGALNIIDGLFAKAPFDPSNAEATIRVATADYIWLVLARHGLGDIHRRAPGLRLNAVEAGLNSVEHLRTSQIDFMIAPSVASPVPWGELQADLLFEDDEVCLVPESSDIVSPMSVEQFERAPHVVYHPSGDEEVLHTYDMVVLRQTGLERRAVITVPNFLLLPFVASAIGGVAICPRRGAELIAPSTGVRIVAPPVPFPRVRMMIISTSLSRSDPVKQWFRDQLLASCADLRPPGPQA